METILFLVNNFMHSIRNNLELITGPVCCGKSEELLRRVTRYEIAGYNVLLVKPAIDTRSTTVKSRSGSERICVDLSCPQDIYDKINNYVNNNSRAIDIVAFDEGQFYKDLYRVVKDLLLKKYKVIVSALDSDFNGDPFGDITKLVTLSDSVSKLTAVCMLCRSDNAIFSQKLKKGGDQIEVGDLELYQPRCINCFVPGGI